MKSRSFRVLVTRPRPQGEELCALLAARGFDPVFFPLIELKALPAADIKKQLHNLDQYAWFIFVSRAAVAAAAPELESLANAVKIAAVGQGTAQALTAAHLPVNLIPTQWSSEGLLASAEFQSLKGKKLAIFCAEGGRELLAETLEARGAEVVPIYCYQRLLPAPDLSLLENQELDALLCTSVLALTQLKQLGLAWLQKIPLVLVSERIMILAKELGFKTCVLAKDASHDSLLQALQTIKESRDALR